MMRRGLAIALVSVAALAGPSVAMAAQHDATPDAVIAAMRAAARGVAPAPRADSVAVVENRRLVGGIARGTKLVPWHDPSLHITARLRVAGKAYPRNNFGTGDSVTYGPYRRHANAVGVTACTDASWVEVLQLGTGYNSNVWFSVDGQRVNDDPVTFPDDARFYVSRVSFTTPGPHCLRAMFNDPLFGGFVIRDDRKIWKPEMTPRLRVMFIGDSFTESAGHWPVLAADLLGWRDTWVSGVGGTGYVMAPPPKPDFLQRFDRDVVPYRPDVLVVAGGINDSSFAPQLIRAAAAEYLDRARQALPNAVILVLGPWNPRAAVPPAVNDAIKSAAAGREHVYWVPNYDDGWIAGTGHAGAPRGDGNSDTMIGDDTTHPTAAGHEYLARRFADHVRRLLGVAP